jgi:hypothetical protein
LGVVPVGIAVGKADGKPLGSAVGIAGKPLGSAVGNPLGIAVGKPLGRAVGKPLGSALGMVGKPGAPLPLGAGPGPACPPPAWCSGWPVSSGATGVGATGAGFAAGALAGGAAAEAGAAGAGAGSSFEQATTAKGIDATTARSAIEPHARAERGNGRTGVGTLMARERTSRRLGI